MKVSQLRDRRVVGGVFLAGTAAVLVVILTRPVPVHPVLVAGGPLAAGVPMQDLELAERAVRDPTGLVAAEGRDALAAWTLRTALDEGEPLVRSLLLAPERHPRPQVLALDLSKGSAVQGDLRTGDLVDVYATTLAGDGREAESHRIAAGVYVISAGSDKGSFGGDDRVHLLLAVDGELAATLLAGRAVDLDLVRVSR